MFLRRSLAHISYMLVNLFLLVQFVGLALHTKKLATLPLFAKLVRLFVYLYVFICLFICFLAAIVM